MDLGGRWIEGAIVLEDGRGKVVVAGCHVLELQFAESLATV